MEKIEHTTVTTNGINMHVASIGKQQSPVILFLHGFPELWYSWRHQMISLSSIGYRCIAPDLRGYGDTDAPPSAASYTVFHLVGDLIGLLDSLEVEQVFLVGHDWGAIIAWYFCLFRPDRIKSLVNLSVPFIPRNPQLKTLDGFRATLGDEFYVVRFQEVGEMEEDLAQQNTTEIMKKFLLPSSPTELFRIPKKTGYRGFPKVQNLPAWLSEEDVNYFSSKFKHTGFTGGLNYYRALNLDWELTAPWTGVQVKVPTMFVMGDLDIVYYFPGMKDYIHNGGFKKDVPDLRDVVIMEGVGHFINQEKPHEITTAIYDFIKQF
jgi:pimeloyl-ACP methyl ester carboxylesterase